MRGEAVDVFRWRVGVLNRSWVVRVRKLVLYILPTVFCLSQLWQYLISCDGSFL